MGHDGRGAGGAAATAGPPGPVHGSKLTGGTCSSSRPCQGPGGRRRCCSTRKTRRTSRPPRFSIRHPGDLALRGPAMSSESTPVQPGSVCANTSTSRPRRISRAAMRPGPAAAASAAAGGRPSADRDGRRGGTGGGPEPGPGLLKSKVTATVSVARRASGRPCQRAAAWAGAGAGRGRMMRHGRRGGAADSDALPRQGPAARPRDRPGAPSRDPPSSPSRPGGRAVVTGPQ